MLFVDEAYALVADGRDQFGKEALDTLIKLSEDHRDDLVVTPNPNPSPSPNPNPNPNPRPSPSPNPNPNPSPSPNPDQVILAGYSTEMKRLLASNPGLRSRFPTTIEFQDYSAAELTAIADGMLGSEMLELTPGARAKLDALFAQLASVHDRENGNGRAVRNLLECAKRCQATRLPYISRASPAHLP